MIASTSIWVTVGPIILINAVLFISYLGFQFWGRKRMNLTFAGAKTAGSKFLSSNTREWWFWTTDPIVNLFVRLKMGPNVLTAMGFFFTSIAAILFSQGWFGYAGWVMIFGASFDMFDGRVARITGKCSRSGAYFDAVTDRFGEGVCLLGLAFYFHDSFMLAVVIAALIGSMAVSYTKARAEGMGVECNVGIMQRPERIVTLGVSAAFDPIMNIFMEDWGMTPRPILVIFAVSAIAVMTLGTAIYRMVYVMNKLDNADRHGPDSLPQIITKLSTPKGRLDFWEKAKFGYDRTKSEFDRVVVFLTGGVPPKILTELLENGDLPNIREHIKDRGIGAIATGVFPSTAGIAVTPFVTGCFPGTCDIPGVKWFDRSVPASRMLTINRFRDYIGWGAYAMDHDLSKSVRTIYEYSRQAVNIFGMLNRGCGLVRDPAFFKMCSRFYLPRKPADLDIARDAAFHWFSRAIKRETDFVLYCFPPVDIAGGHSKIKDLAYAEMRQIDESVGQAAKLLKKKEMYDKTLIILSAGHSIAEAEEKLGLDDLLSQKYSSAGNREKLKDWQNAEIISLSSGSSMAHVYIKNGDSWQERSFFEDAERKGLVGELLVEKGVDILAGRSVDGGVVVQSSRGRANILEDQDGRITYRIKGADPFGLVNVPSLLESKSAYEVTKTSSYPDGIMQVLQLLRSRRSGDLIVSAAPNTSLNVNGGFFTSGSLAREHIEVPFMASSKNISGVNRTADVFAMTLEMLGIDAEHKMDGEFSETTL